MKPLLPLKKLVFIFLFHPDGTAERCDIEGRPNGFGTYQSAFSYIYAHPELPVIAGVGEVYLRG